MPMLPVIRQTLTGVACEVEWDNDREDIAPFSINRIVLHPRPCPGGDLMPTNRQASTLPIGDPLWPMTEAGRRLRRLYLEDGERVLCALPASPEWWCTPDW